MKRLIVPLAVVAVGCAPAIYASSATNAPRESDRALSIRPSYAACSQRANTTADMVGCANDEYAFQDKRLNDVYKRLMVSLPEAKQKVLRTEERQWVGYKMKHCKPPADGGTLSLVTSADCAVQETAKRATELEKRLKR